MPLSDQMQNCYNCGDLIFPGCDSHVKEGKFICRKADDESEANSVLRVGGSHAVSVSSENPAASPPGQKQTCVECGRGTGQLHKPQCSHTGRFLGEKETDVSAGAAHPTEVLYEGDVVP